MNCANKLKSISIIWKDFIWKNNKIFYFICWIKDFIIFIIENKNNFWKNNIIQELENFIDKLSEVDLYSKERIEICLNDFINILDKIPEKINDDLWEKIKIFLTKVKNWIDISTYNKEKSKNKKIYLYLEIFDFLKNKIKNKSIKEIIYNFFDNNF